MKLPTFAAIVEAQRELLQTLELEGDPTETCWACGASVWPPDKAHIVARSRGGSVEPENFFLLCRLCHREQPDGVTPAAQIEWVRSHETQAQRFLRLFGPVLNQRNRPAQDVLTRPPVPERSPVDYVHAAPAL